MKDDLERFHHYLAAGILSILSLFYLAALRVLYFLRRLGIERRYKPEAKVISVGNITLGGTGKTPFTIMLSRYARDSGKKVAVLHRGCGKDEDALLSEKLKGVRVLTGRDRIASARKAQKEYGCDCIVLDDGFQHYRLERDIDILLIDAVDPFGNMSLFPRGILREPLSRIREADFAIVTKADCGKDNLKRIYETLAVYNKGIETAEANYRAVGLKEVFGEKVFPPSYVKDRRVVLLTGIANPGYFAWMVSELGGIPVGRFDFPDHHEFTPSQVERAVSVSRQRTDGIVMTTEKDAVRLKRLGKPYGDTEFLSVEIEIDLTKNKDKVIARLDSLCNN